MKKAIKKFLVGLTGGIGSGKSTAANFFKELGIDVVDADVIAREIRQQPTVIKKIIDHFGESLLDNHKELNRAKLKEIILNSPPERTWLENLLHPLIIKEMYAQAELATSPYVLLIAPLLIEKPIPVDRILVIDSPPELQVKRLQSRDQLTPEQIQVFLKIQASREQRLTKADDVISNDKDLKTLKQLVAELHNKYLAFASNKSF